MIEVIRWLIAVLAGSLFLFCCLANWSIVAGLVLRQIRSTSLVLPFLGPIFGLGFFLSLPIDGVKKYWWLSFLLEPTWLLGVWGILGSFFSSDDDSSVEPIADSSQQKRQERIDPS